MSRSHLPDKAARSSIERWYEAGLRAVDPREAVKRHLRWDGSRLQVVSMPVSAREDGRIVGIAI
ncbi:MAG: hypothetical protein WKF63_06160, partial [Thermomicrobiales bacterium]